MPIILPPKRSTGKYVNQFGSNIAAGIRAYTLRKDMIEDAKLKYQRDMVARGYSSIEPDEVDKNSVRDPAGQYWRPPLEETVKGKKDYRLFYKEGTETGEPRHYKQFAKDTDIEPGYIPYEKDTTKGVKFTKRTLYNKDTKETVEVYSEEQYNDYKKQNFVDVKPKELENYDLFEKRDEKGKIEETKYFRKGSTIPTGFSKAKGISVSATGGAGGSATMSPPTKTALEKGIMNPTTTISQYQDMIKSYDKDFFTYYGKGAAWTEEVGAKLGIGKAEWAGSQRSFMQDVEQAFNKYRKEITGAQASMQEIRFLKTTIPSGDDSGPVFMAKAKRFIIGLARLRKRNAILLQQGLPLPNKDDEDSSMPFSEIDLTQKEVESLGLKWGDEIVMEAFGKKKDKTSTIKTANDFLNKYK